MMSALTLFNRIAEKVIPIIKDPDFNTTIAAESNDVDDFIGIRFCHEADTREKLISANFRDFTLNATEVQQIHQLYDELNNILFLFMESLNTTIPPVNIQLIPSVINSIIIAMYNIVPSAQESFSQRPAAQPINALTLSVAENLDQRLISHGLLLAPALSPLCARSLVQTPMQTEQPAPRLFSFRPLFINPRRFVENTRTFLNSLNCLRNRG